MQGALNFDLTVRNGAIQLDSVRLFPNGKLAIENSVTSDFERRSYYEGPDINTYDEALIEKFYQYLEERGITNEFAEFIDSFSILKERRDYRDWLRTAGKFLEL